MLIKVFGIWLMASSIVTLERYGTQKCFINTIKAETATKIFAIDKPCDEVAVEINRAIKESKE